MDFYVTLAAKNELMGYVNLIVPAVIGAVTGIGGVLIGIFVSGRRERLKREQEIQNMRSMLYCIWHNNSGTPAKCVKIGWR